MSTFYNSNGDVVNTGRELGRGGEGAVYELQTDTESVAKIYHENISADKSEKLRQMVALKSDKLLKLAAWVTDTLHDTPYGKTVGFTMPRINSGTAIHELYNPRSRRQHFPEADWRFLIAAAANLARAFSVVHAHGHRIGDVNHGNVVIARDATVRLIDCDSCHLNAPGRSFLCEVGVSTHTPPELQGHTLRDLERTPDHDAFGLAVLIFQLLFMGRHPFSGSFLGDGENTLESSIKERRFAYGDDANARQMRQPPGTLPLAAIPATIKVLFERAFLEIENRPTAREWIEALEDLGKKLQQCSLNNAHFYLDSLDKCSWCKLESETGVMFFPARFTGEWGANGEIDLYTLGQLIDQIKPPDVSQSLIKTHSQQLVPVGKLPTSPKLKESLANYNYGLAAYLAVLGLAIVLLVAFVGFSFLFYIFQLAFGGFWICWGIIKSLTKTAREEAQLTLDAAHQKWQEFKEQIDKKNLAQPFEATRADLKTAIKSFNDLPKQKEARLKEIEAVEYQQQLYLYLKRFSIKKAGIVGLNDERLEVLASSGIKNAADITKTIFLQISHFSHSHKKKLFEWRAELEKDFVFKFTSKIKQEVQQTAENDIAAVRLQLEAKLRNGLPDLQRMAQQINQKQHDLTVESETLAANVRQAESDFKQISDLQKQAIAWTIGVTLAGFAVGVPVRNLTYSGDINQYDHPPRAVQTNSSVGRVTSSSATVGKATADYDKKEIVNPKEWGRAGELYEQGEKLFANGNYKNAVAVYQDAINENSRISEIHGRLGDVFVRLNRYSDAVESYKNAVKISSSSNSDSYYKLGLAYKKLGLVDNAKLSFEYAIQTDAKAATSYYELGLIFKKAGKTDEAITNFANAVSANPSLAEPHYELALLYFGDNDNFEAWEEYDALLAIETPEAKRLARHLRIKLPRRTLSAVGTDVDEASPLAPAPPVVTIPMRSAER